MIAYCQHTRVLLMLDGGCTLECGDTYELSAGHIALIPQGADCIIHHFQKYRILSIYGEFIKPLPCDTITILRDSVNNDGRKLAELIFHNRYGNEDYLYSLCNALIEFIIHKLERAPKDTTAAVYKIIRRIEKNYANSDLSVGALLDESGYARDYIRMEFHNITNTTPKKYLNNTRMEKAKALIERHCNDMSIGEIAEQCGILDQTIFSRIFKKHFGVTPSEYKNKISASGR